MIKKEQYIRKDGVVLCRTFSDTDHLIRHVNSGNVFSEAIDVTDNELYEEMDEYVELDTISNYEDVIEVQESMLGISKQINRLHLSNKEALSVMGFYPRWEDKIGCTVENGFNLLYDGKLWKVRQTHTAQSAYPPSIHTASMYEVVEAEHDGTVDDPIPYIAPMEIFDGKYYTQNGTMYLCIRDSGVALTHELSSLVDIYVELIN